MGFFFLSGRNTGKLDYFANVRRTPTKLSTLTRTPALLRPVLSSWEPNLSIHLKIKKWKKREVLLFCSICKNASLQKNGTFFLIWTGGGMGWWNFLKTIDPALLRPVLDSCGSELLRTVEFKQIGPVNFFFWGRFVDHTMWLFLTFPHLSWW